MINTLVAFGCSNTYGCEAIGTNRKTFQCMFNSYPYFLSQKLNLAYRNYAKNGSSNNAIGMSVVDFLLKNPNLHSKIFVVIGWTGDNRMTVLNPTGHEDNISQHGEINESVLIKDIDRKAPNQLFPYLSNLCDKIFINSKLTKKLLFSHYIEKYGNDQKDFLRYMLRDLLSIFVFNTEPYTFTNTAIRYSIIQLLQSCNITYLTLPTITHYPHPLYELFPSKNNIKCYDTNENMIFDPESMFQAYKYNGAGHTSVFGHTKIASYLYDYIKEQNILTT